MFCRSVQRCALWNSDFGMDASPSPPAPPFCAAGRFAAWRQRPPLAACPKSIRCASGRFRRHRPSGAGQRSSGPSPGRPSTKQYVSGPTVWSWRRSEAIPTAGRCATPRSKESPRNGQQHLGRVPAAWPCGTPYPHLSRQGSCRNTGRFPHTSELGHDVSVRQTALGAPTGLALRKTAMAKA